MSDGIDSVIIELKLFNLINSKLKDESDEEILKRNYMFWCKNEQKSKLVKVEKYINDGNVQLNTYINIVKKGGISDERIIRYYGKNYVWGFFIASFGTERILVKRSNIKSSNFTFKINNKNM
ncbi:hypothetical protein C1646_775265 [Rhizophagus diaphanus]|nr:hypothetical protein C1646_775265 [Rhizophagus diaphanus] [Rhizophagus sp. MUCL 43196]